MKLSADGVDEALGRAIAAVVGRPLQGGARAGGGGAQNATRVACVRSDAHPPVVWRMWLPAFCSLGFVKELRLKPWSGRGACLRLYYNFLYASTLHT